MAYVVQNRNRFKNVKNTRRGSISIPPVTYDGFFAQAKYVSPHVLDTARKDDEVDVFFTNATSRKYFLPSPPFMGNDGIENDPEHKYFRKIMLSNG